MSLSQCQRCSQDFSSKYSHQKYCTPKCRNRANVAASANRDKEKAANICTECGTKTHNPKFCSRSCSAKTANAIRPKRKKLKRYYCRICSTETSGYKRYCSPCKSAEKHLRWQTLGDMLQRFPGFAQTTSLAPLRIRAKKVLVSLNKTSCEVCGYARHVEAAHIKPVSSFSLDTLITTINSADNLAALCPTHHWELDNGFVQLNR